MVYKAPYNILIILMAVLYEGHPTPDHGASVASLLSD